MVRKSRRVTKHTLRKQRTLRNQRTLRKQRKHAYGGSANNVQHLEDTVRAAFLKMYPNGNIYGPEYKIFVQDYVQKHSPHMMQYVNSITSVY